MEDLITLYRGVDKVVDDFTPKSFEGNILEGRWWGEDPKASRNYAKGMLKGPAKLGGVMYEMDVSPKTLAKSDTFRNKLIDRGYDFLDNPKWNPKAYLATKELIKEGAPKINWGQTALTNLEALGDIGIGFLKNYGLKGLQLLASLPAQAGIMALTPTTMGNAEITLPPQGGGGGDGRYGRGSDGQQSYDFGQGFGINATTGGPVSNRSGRGRTDYGIGGLV